MNKTEQEMNSQQVEMRWDEMSDINFVYAFSVNFVVLHDNHLPGILLTT